MKRAHAKDPGPRRARKRIAFRTVVMAWGVTLFTLSVFVVGTIPAQRETLVSNMRRQAEIVARSVTQVTIKSIVVEDYGTVIEHCMKVVKDPETVPYVVVTRKDGFSLVTTAEGWRQEQLAGIWTAGDATDGMFVTTELDDEEVFHYSYPVRHSGIDWGWLHMGFSLEQYRSSLRTAYIRTMLPPLSAPYAATRCRSSSRAG